MQPFRHSRNGPKILGWELRPFWGKGTGSPSNTKSPGPRPTSIPSGILISPPSRLATTDMGCKLGRGYAPLGEGSWVSILHNVGWTKAHLHAKCHLDPSSRLVTIDMGQKLGGSAPFLGRGLGSRTNTKSPGLRPASIPSDILMHPAVWPQ